MKENSDARFGFEINTFCSFENRVGGTDCFKQLWLMNLRFAKLMNKSLVCKVTERMQVERR